MSASFDGAHGDVVLFGGDLYPTIYNDTWVYDGTTWTQQFPTTSPPSGSSTGMAYDAARQKIVLFDGGGTWTWDGSSWANALPVVSPSQLYGVAMAYDAARRQVVLFGGAVSDGQVFGDTWVWNGTSWRIPFIAQTSLAPDSGSAGTTVQVSGSGYAGLEYVRISFVDSTLGKTSLGEFKTDASGNLIANVTVPARATVGAQTILAVGLSRQAARTTFTVTLS
jgi:hypothetical protein